MQRHRGVMKCDLLAKMKVAIRPDLVFEVGSAERGGRTGFYGSGGSGETDGKAQNALGESIGRALHQLG
jgi:hypothetical protein